MTRASRLDFILYSKGRGSHRDGAMWRNDVIRVTLRKTSYLECHIPQGMIGNSQGSPVVGTPHFHCKGPRFDPLLGN